MNRNELVDQCKRLIAEAYQEATETIVAYLESQPDEQRQSLCKEIDPENWSALDARVRRLQEKRRSGADSAPTRTLSNQQSSARHARSTMRNPDISPEHKASVVAEADAASKRAIFERLANDPDVADDDGTVSRAEHHLRSHSRPATAGPRPKPQVSLSEDWHAWLNRLNSVLMDGARLAEETDKAGATADVYGELGFIIYQRITEKKLDAELRDLLDNSEVVS